MTGVWAKKHEQMYNLNNKPEILYINWYIKYFFSVGITENILVIKNSTISCSKIINDLKGSPSAFN